MLCENCNENEATIHYTEVINGIKSEHHICGECASKMDLGGYSTMFGDGLPFARLLTGLFAAGRSFGTEENPMAHIICPQCKMNYEEFTKVGKFGCAECYSVFGPLIDDSIKKIQGSSEHRGKRYSNDEESDLRDITQQEKALGADEEIKLLQAKLKTAIAIEDYEKAASLRDRIKSIKAENSQSE